MSLVRASSQNVRTCGMVLRIFVDPYPQNLAMSGNCGNFVNNLGGRVRRRFTFTYQVSGSRILEDLDIDLEDLKWT